jgi:phage N-6-adenine-methyltransferase
MIRQNYRTPLWFRDKLATIWTFDLDAAADEHNTLADRWYGPGGIYGDALTIPWEGDCVWCNPPYGQKHGGIRRWLEQGIKSVEEGSAGTVVFLLPANTATSWFHELCAPHAPIFLRPRIAFEVEDWKTEPSPRHDSMLVVFSGEARAVRPAATTTETILLWRLK